MRLLRYCVRLSIRFGGDNCMTVYCKTAALQHALPICFASEPESLLEWYVEILDRGQGSRRIQWSVCWVSCGLAKGMCIRGAGKLTWSSTPRTRISSWPPGPSHLAAPQAWQVCAVPGLCCPHSTYLPRRPTAVSTSTADEDMLCLMVQAGSGAAAPQPRVPA